MAEYQSRVRNVTHYEWAIPAEEPWGAAAVEIHKALAAAEQKYQALYGRIPSEDHWCAFFPGDGEIVIRITADEVTR
jgi:hypothetical protein